MTRLLRLHDQAPGTVQSLGRVGLPVPNEPEPGMRSVHFALKAGDGTVIARNSLDVAIHPRELPLTGDRHALVAEPRHCAHLQALGYRVAAEPTADALWVATSRNAEIDAHVRQGGRLLLLPNSEFELSPLFPHWQNVKVQERAETLWQGDWASSFGWLHRSQAFSRVPGEPLLDETFDRVLPTRCHKRLQSARFPGPCACRLGCRLGSQAGGARGRAPIRQGSIRRLDLPPVPRPTRRRSDRDRAARQSARALALAQGTAASRDREAVISEMVERARMPRPVRSP